MTPNATVYADALKSIIKALSADPGLKANVSDEDMAGGIAATRKLNKLLATVIDETGVNDDNLITPEELMMVSDAIRANHIYRGQFAIAHGDDEWDSETGFHLLQNDGGTMTFQGRKLVDTVVDAIFHVGFEYHDGRFVNEDGNANEQVADVAGWLNYFLNGENYVFGTAGDDELHSGSFSDKVADAANETFDAGAGNDKIWGGDGADNILAGAGDDVSGGGNGNDRMHGGAGLDQLWGDNGNDQIWGQAGNDLLGGGFGNDRMYGGNGNDVIHGQEGRDKLFGGNGNDIIGGGTDNDLIYGDAGNDDLWGDSGDDTIEGGDGDDEIGGGLGDDDIKGGDGNDLLSGHEGSDMIFGGAGNDLIWGSDGADRLTGGSGNDEISGGNGSDIINGGAGADKITLWDSDNAQDRLIFSDGDSGLTLATIDRVEGFKSGQDVIDLRSFGTMTLAELDYTGGGAASVYYDGHYLRIDADGDRASDLIIEFKYVSELVASDFLFA